MSNDTQPAPTTGRPRKNADEKRTARFNIRYTIAEREAVRDLAARAGLSEMEFHRRCALQAPLPASPGASDPARVAALNATALALSKIGNNLNQLAAATHQDRDIAIYWREVGDKVQDDLNTVRTALYEALEGVEQ